MRTLDSIELECLLDFISPDGYVFDLSDNRFNDFTERVVGVRVKELYTDPPLSKGKALRRFVSEPGNEEKGYQLITSLFNYYELKMHGTKSPCAQPESQFEKCRAILKSYKSIFDHSAVTASYDRIKEKFLSLFKDGAYWKQGGDPAVGLAIALEPMTDLVRHCIANKIDGLFSNPLFIRTLVELQSFGGEGTMPHESQQAEAAWNTFGTTLIAYLTALSKSRSISVAEFKAFLNRNKEIYDNRKGFYRSIMAKPLSELNEHCSKTAAALHSNDEAFLEIMYAGVFSDEWNQFDFLAVSDAPTAQSIELQVHRRADKERSKQPPQAQDELADQIANKVSKKVLVELQEGQKTIKSNQGQMISRLKTIQKTVEGNHTKITEKSKANKKRVDAAVDRYYHLVKEGTEERLAKTDACREIEQEQGLGDYGSFGSFRNAVARIIKERDNKYGNNAAKAYFDEHPDD